MPPALRDAASLPHPKAPQSPFVFTVLQIPFPATHLFSHPYKTPGGVPWTPSIFHALCWRLPRAVWDGESNCSAFAPLIFSATAVSRDYCSWRAFPRILSLAVKIGALPVSLAGGRATDGDHGNDRSARAGSAGTSRAATDHRGGCFRFCAGFGVGGVHVPAGIFASRGQRQQMDHARGLLRLLRADDAVHRLLAGAPAHGAQLEGTDPARAGTQYRAATPSQRRFAAHYAGHQSFLGS